MNRAEFKRAFPNATHDVIAANCPPDIRANDTGQAAKPERTARPEMVGATRAKKEHHGRFLVRYSCVRKRLCDEDNLIAKFHTDLLRYAGIIPGDAPAQCRIESPTQRKCEEGEAESVTIQVYQLQ